MLKEKLIIPEKLWKKIMNETLNNASSLLQSAEILLNNKGSTSICAGLYMYAFEEYGKFLLLSNYQLTNGYVTISYRNEFRNHREKFNIALKSSPKECTCLNSAVFDEMVYDVPVFEGDEIPDFETRNNVFYSDFTMDEKDVRPFPTVDIELLKRAIQCLKDIVVSAKSP